MSTYTPSGSGPWNASVVVPDDGDPATAASINGPLEAVADNVEFLYGIRGSNRIVQITHYDVPSQTITATSATSILLAPLTTGAIAGDLVSIAVSLQLSLTDAAAPIAANVYASTSDGSSAPVGGLASTLAMPTSATGYAFVQTLSGICVATGTAPTVDVLANRYAATLTFILSGSITIITCRAQP